MIRRSAIDPAAATDLDSLWLLTVEEVMSKAAHEVKDTLNGVTVNLEVIRSRSARQEEGRTGRNADSKSVSVFAHAAAEQLEVLSTRLESVLFLARPPRGEADVAIALRHL